MYKERNVKWWNTMSCPQLARLLSVQRDKIREAREEVDKKLGERGKVWKVSQRDSDGWKERGNWLLRA